jgi:hypothetical protein
MRYLGRTCALLCALGAAVPAAASAEPEYIVGLRPGAAPDAVAAAGGKVTRELRIIHAVGARLSRGEARRLRARPGAAAARAA